MDNAYRNGLDSATEDAPIAYILIMSNDGKIAGQPYLPLIGVNTRPLILLTTEKSSSV